MDIRTYYCYVNRFKRKILNYFKFLIAWELKKENTASPRP